MKLGKEFIFNWCEVGQTLPDISWSRDDIKPFTSMQELFSKPDAIENLQSTFCANTQGIFQGNFVNFRHLGSFENRNKVSAK